MKLLTSWEEKFDNELIVRGELWTFKCYYIIRTMTGTKTTGLVNWYSTEVYHDTALYEFLRTKALK